MENHITYTDSDGFTYKISFVSDVISTYVSILNAFNLLRSIKISEIEDNTYYWQEIFNHRRDHWLYLEPGLKLYIEKLIKLKAFI